MQLKKLLLGFLILISVSLFAETDPNYRKKEKKNVSTDSIQIGIDYLKKYFYSTDVWQSENPEILRSVNGLIHFAEDERLDSILVKLDLFQKKQDFRYIYRSPMQVNDSLQVSGYLSWQTIREKMKQLDRAIWKSIDLNTIPLSKSLIAQSQNRKEPIVPGDEKAILDRTGIVLPDSLIDVNAMPDSLMHKPNNFSRIKNREQLRNQILENARVKYNSNIQKANLDSVITAYRIYAVKIYSDSLQNQLHDSLKVQNKLILMHYNDSIVRSVNDSINRFVQTLQRYAQNDSVSVWVHNSSGKPQQLWLRNNQQTGCRMYIRNEQNDSLGIKLMNIDKHSIRIAIEDDVTFSRISQKQHRDYVFEKFTPDRHLTKIQKKFDIITPWDYGGFGTFGFSQTYLNNWKAGGSSAFSFLMVMKGYANYSNNVIKWENSGELRNGWIRQGGELNQTQKNDDKLELISRLGVIAFKKWYYSSEIDYQTQFFNGYNYPDKTKLISTYMSPAKTMFKLGLDYKPNKRFSLFLSPFTLKTVFVRDTARIDQTTYGIAANRRSFWEPGMNADIKFRIEFTPQIAYETKYKMFMNYKEPFRKFDINWENTFVAQLTDRINMTFMLNLLYDDNVTFPTGKMNAAGVEIFKPKLQTRELTTIGFSYKINRHVYQRRKVE